MHLLYVDMSGTVGNPRERHFIMAGVAVYETAVFHVIQELDALLREELGPEAAENMELHGNEMLGGRKSWRSVPREKRERLFDKALAVDQEGGVVHGLYHHKLPDRPCDCAACASRRFNR